MKKPKPKPKPKPRRNWWHWPWALIKFIGLSVLSAFIVFQIFAWVRSPEATVVVQGLQRNYCVMYSVQLMHSRTIDSANFEIRFPSKLNDLQMGVTENVGRNEEHWMRMMASEFDMDACYLRRAINQVDTSGMPGHIVGNTLFVRSGTLIGNTPLMGNAIGPTHQSTSEPAPKEPRFQGEYSYTVFGISVQRSLEYVNAGTTEAK